MTSPREMCCEVVTGIQGNETISYNVVQKASPDVYECCNGTAYNPLLFICCKRTLHARDVRNPATYRLKCCGTQLIDAYTQVCCGEATSSAVSSDACCGTKPYDSSINVCCGCDVVSRAFGYNTGCCGATTFDPSVQFCCQDTLYNRTDYPQSAYPLGCCGAQAYSLTNQSCCNGMTYNINSQVCCGGQVTEKQGNNLIKCCGVQLFDPNSQFCCAGEVYSIADNTNLRCCHDWQTYDLSRQRCCAGQVMTLGFVYPGPYCY